MVLSIITPNVANMVFWMLNTLCIAENHPTRDTFFLFYTLLDSIHYYIVILYLCLWGIIFFFWNFTFRNVFLSLWWWSYSGLIKWVKIFLTGSPEWLSGFSTCLQPGAWSWSPEIKSHIGLPAWSLLLPLPVSLPFSLFLCLSWINK